MKARFNTGHTDMKRARLTWTMATGTCAALALALAPAARADVKAGVDAWSAGDHAKAIAEWRGPAAKGDADALFNLAQAYRLGRGVPEDVQQAEALYAKAAARGHLKAADNYGLLLFQDGRRQQAMPYVTAAAERGDPRAQYLIGLAHFNGDLLPKDWVRAYALLTLANGAGLPQAAPAIRQMDEFVPLPQRQQAQVLATTLRANADSARASQLAAADLGQRPAAVSAPAPASAAPAIAAALPAPRLPTAIAAVTIPPSLAAAEAAVAEAVGATGTDSPAEAGAGFARASSVRPDLSQDAAKSQTTGATRTEPKPAAPADRSGPWKLQLGAFSVAGGADRAWAQVAGTTALSGKSRQTASAGRLTKLFAIGWRSEADAQTACKALKSGGHACVVTR